MAIGLAKLDLITVFVECVLYGESSLTAAAIVTDKCVPTRFLSSSVHNIFFNSYETAENKTPSIERNSENSFCCPCNALACNIGPFTPDIFSLPPADK